MNTRWQKWRAGWREILTLLREFRWPLLAFIGSPEQLNRLIHDNEG